jgi:uroporphyrinogen-III synthase
MRVLVTRPIQDAEPLKTRVEALGCEVLLAPLMETVVNEIPAGTLDGATALIATSRNALAALAASSARASFTSVPFYAVGPGTAAAARNMGFHDVIEGAGNVEALVPVLCEDRAPNKRLIYLRGDVVAFDLEGVLAARGLKVVPVQAYETLEAEALPLEVIEALRGRGVDAVTLMSPRTARIWLRLVEALSPPVQLSGVAHLCLSERVGEALGALAKTAKVLVTSQPNVQEMLALIEGLAASSRAEKQGP